VREVQGLLDRLDMGWARRPAGLVEGTEGGGRRVERVD